MSYKEYQGYGVRVRYFPDTKTMVLAPIKGQKNSYQKLRSKLDTLLQIEGQKQIGKEISLKLSDSFNVNVEELLKSLGLKGGLEREDAASMVDDATKEQQKKDENLQAPNAQQPQLANGMGDQQQPGLPPQDQLPEAINLSVVSFLFEDFSFAKKKSERRKAKRYGKYWTPIEQFCGKNKNAIKPNDILDIRKKFSLKPESQERNVMLDSLDKAASYFYSRLESEKGLAAAQDFDEKYVSIDSLRPDDYEIDTENNSDTMGGQMSLAVPDFDEVDYDDIDIER